MKIAATAILCFLMIIAVQARLNTGPAIESVAMDQKDPDLIYLRINSQSVKAALSTNGGMSFQGIQEASIPSNLTTNLTLGTRRYVLTDWTFLRSDDGGVTWTNTGTTTFMRKLVNEEIAVEKKQFWEEYGSRLPERSVFWHILFALFGLTYAIITFYVLRAHGFTGAILTALRGLIVILLVWCLLWIIHTVFYHWAEMQYPNAYWNTSAEFRPNAKTGFIMSIAARPLALLAYLLVLWPILPGSVNVILGPDPTPRREKYTWAAVIAIGAGFVVFHLCMMFVGYFQG